MKTTNIIGIQGESGYSLKIVTTTREIISPDRPEEYRWFDCFLNLKMPVGSVRFELCLTDVELSILRTDIRTMLSFELNQLEFASLEDSLTLKLSLLNTGRIIVNVMSTDDRFSVSVSCTFDSAIIDLENGFRELDRFVNIFEN